MDSENRDINTESQIGVTNRAALISSDKEHYEIENDKENDSTSQPPSGDHISLHPSPASLDGVATQSVFSNAFEDAIHQVALKNGIMQHQKFFTGKACMSPELSQLAVFGTSALTASHCSSLYNSILAQHVLDA